MAGHYYKIQSHFRCMTPSSEISQKSYYSWLFSAATLFVWKTRFEITS